MLATRRCWLLAFSVTLAGCVRVGFAPIGDSPAVDGASDRARDTVVPDRRTDGPTLDSAPGPGDAPLEAVTPVLTPLAVDDGRLWISEGSALRLYTYRSATGTFSPEPEVPTPSGKVLWISYLILPSAELVALKVLNANNPSLELWHSAGGPWKMLASDSVGNPATRDFHLRKEEKSGVAMLVFGTGGAQPRYRRIVGNVVAASASLPVNDGAGQGPDLSTGAVLWVELVSRPGTNELALLFADQNAVRVTMRWTGTEWDTASGVVLETALKRNPVTNIVSNRVFDGAYQNSGALLVAWGREATNGAQWRLKAPSQNWTNAVTLHAVAGVPHAVDLSAEPGSDRVAACLLDLGDGVERLGLASWDGGAWVGKEYDSQIRDLNGTAVGRAPGAVAWRGASKQAVAVYADDTSGVIDAFSWTTGDWKAMADALVADKGLTDSVVLRSLSTKDRLLLAIADDKQQLHVASYEGSNWAVEPKLSTALASSTSVPFALELKP